MTFANGYANIRQVFEYIVFRYMIFINFSSNLLQLYNKIGIWHSKIIPTSYFDVKNLSLIKIQSFYRLFAIH